MSIKVKDIKNPSSPPAQKTSIEKKLLKFVAEHPEDAFTWLELAKVVGVLPEAPNVKSGIDALAVLVGAGIGLAVAAAATNGPLENFILTLDELVKAGKLEKDRASDGTIHYWYAATLGNSLGAEAPVEAPLGG